ERELERVMRDFYQQRCNLLLCSTIIESGLDVPTANTIIIDRADRFGLAQLHQLRGRVGRSHHQAYAYLLTPPEEALSTQAKKRLEAIQLMEELGSGFYLAMHDLEIRGAGEVLGEEQSGEMQQIGFQLYVDMLKAAVDALKAGREPDLTEPLGVTKIDAGPERSQIQFAPEPPFDPAKLIALIQKDGRHRFAGQDRVRIERAAPSLEERSALVREFLGRLA